ncbi:F-box protein PP2-A13 isoform X1 [Spinacia oleracea]|uniref:F-box protein PP2-A13 isoform X1 n=1 Tax=Spinacia oleracea TaxID=3562 RepID=A0ABM3RD65_SPIOL|nr:F-box protein PP2-A13 isoform X1 [Spinacia oleracea]
MGVGMSSTDGGNHGGETPEYRRKLEDIPESCIAMVLGHLDPPEICRLARLNRAFRGASSADFIWETKLPTNYSFIVNKISELNHKNDDDMKNYGGSKDISTGLNKKDIFARLSRHNLFDSGNKEIWLDKKTGGVCVSISSKALSITGIDDRRYWNHIPTEESSRFQTVAYLLQIWWFEVCGELEFKFPAGTYSLFFRIQLGKSSKRFGRRSCNVEHIHGWNLRPVRFQLTTSDGQHASSECYLDSPGSWILYHGGDFVVKETDKLTKIKFSARQIDCTHIKGGLSFDSVMILPKSIASKAR